MSIRIYSGFRVPGHTLESLHPVLQSLHSEWVSFGQLLSQQWTVGRATELFDRHHFGLPLDRSLDPSGLYNGCNWLSAAWSERQARCKAVRASNLRDPEIDLTSELAFFLVDGMLLGMAFLEHKELQKRWEAVPWKTDFSYWNGSEGPREVSEEEWAFRQATWRKVFQGSWVPSDVGYIRRLLSPETILPDGSDTAIEAALPSPEVRVKAIALDLFLKEHPQPLERNSGDSLVKAVRLLRTIENSTEFSAFRSELGNRLPDVNVAALRAKADGRFLGLAD